MARLYTSSTIIILAMNVRTEGGMEMRATRRSFDKSQLTFCAGESLGNQAGQWPPTALKTQASSSLTKVLGV